MQERPNADTGTPWTALALQDLRESIRLGFPLREIADFLRRTEREVSEKTAELGIMRRAV